MTTTASSTARTAAGDRGVLLADALSVNALTSAATGAVLALGGVWLDDALGAPAVVLVGVGFGLVLFAAGIGVALTRPRRLRSTARAIVAADLVWVAGAAVVVPAEVLTPLGDVLLTVVSMLTSPASPQRRRSASAAQATPESSGYATSRSAPAAR